MRIATIHAAHLGPGHPHPLRRRRQKAPDHPLGGIHQSANPRVSIFASGTTGRSVRSLPPSKCNASIATTAPRTPLKPDRAVNQAMANGQIPASLPFVKKESRGASQGRSTGSAERIPAALSAFYSQNYPDAAAKQGAAIQAAGASFGRDLSTQCVSGPQGHLGNLSQQSWPHRFSRLLPLPR